MLYILKVSGRTLKFQLDRKSRLLNIYMRGKTRLNLWPVTAKIDARLLLSNTLTHIINNSLLLLPNDPILDHKSRWIIIHSMHSFGQCLNVNCSKGERGKKKKKFAKSAFFTGTVKLHLVIEIKCERDKISRLCFSAKI